MVTILVINTKTRRNLRKRVYCSCTSLSQFHITMKEVRTGTKAGQDPENRADAEAMEGVLHTGLLHMTYSLIECRTTSTIHNGLGPSPINH